ncbi:hypothetical protein N8T08_001916 [Aspergillus melleus]|uniref:Uncharacterized protein n=1 Tax=Aspergillus melleus TaxID=138277 RepID=A0ACC3B9W3_9EURO|nr:hypothetical protein N8T08_001916 [Aspergillus melleus]
MQISSLLLGIAALFATAAVADKTCTPSFDYCASELLEKKGFSEDDLKTALKDSEYENEDFKNILFHCMNPGYVGHAKLCASGCEASEQEGSRKC